MFEGPIKHIADKADGEKPVLRELRWPELLARLEATRELRRDDGTPCEAGFANFSTTSETQAGASPLHSAPAGDGENVSKNRQSVNQDLSSDGKTNPVLPTSGRKEATPDDREML